MEKQMKTVKQYSYPLPAEKWEMLHAIGKDYMAIKNYVYERYSGVGSLGKIDPGYTVQNEMTASGLRKQMNITSVYFYRAIFDAIQDIKMQWQRLRDKIRVLVMRNGNLSEKERQYVCWIVKHPKLYARAVQRKRVDLPPHLQGSGINTGKLRNLVCRLTRRHKERKCHAQGSGSFSVTNRAYQYVAGGIKISTKYPNRRVFIPLTDKNRYEKQLLLKLESKGRIVLHVPVQQRIRKQSGDTNGIGIGIRFGYAQMLQTSNGHVYGEKLGEYMTRETERLKEKNERRQSIRAQSRESMERGEQGKAERIKRNNLGEQKYREQKRRADAAIKSYINGEINRMIETEKLDRIEIPKREKIKYRQVANEYRAYVSRWLLGYIRQRLEYKCGHKGIELVEKKVENGYQYDEFKKKACGSDGRIVKDAS